MRKYVRNINDNAVEGHNFVRKLFNTKIITSDILYTKYIHDLYSMYAICVPKPYFLLSILQVDNTDAEGRLLLADALCYSHSFNPSAVIDLATLTGAIDVALGSGAAAVFTNSHQL